MPYRKTGRDGDDGCPSPFPFLVLLEPNMDDKLIFRAAVAYHKLLTNIAQKNQTSANLPYHMSQVKNLMHEISIWTRRLDIAEVKGWKKATHFLKNNMIRGLLKKIANNFAVMESELLEENEICVPSIKELWQEIKSVNGLFDDCQYKKNRLSIVTKPITLESHDISIAFGRFRIILDFKAGLSNNSCENLVYMEALEPNSAISEESLIHPHVRKDDPCLGEAIGLMQEPFMRGQIESVFLILNSMLNTYNPASPYRTLKEWYDEGCTCGVCGESVREDEACSCTGCEDTLCASCTIYCNRCGEYYCESCMIYTCGWCEESVCEGCDRYACKECDMNLCKSCIHGCCETYCIDCSPICDSCSNSFCPECEGGECTVCNKRYCENCLLSCEACNADTCNDCGNECAECDDVTCPECTRHCDNCNKDYCKECIDEEECSLLKEKV